MMSDRESNNESKKSENDTQKNFRTKTEISINSNIILLNHTPSSLNAEEEREESIKNMILKNEIEKEEKIIEG
jgi:hypothetical protein